MIRSEADARDFVSGLTAADVDSVARLEKLGTLLAEENGRQNLVSSASLDDVWVRHFADSAQLLQYVPRETSGPWIDLGTGAGFPGLVIAALRPDMPVKMVESRARRVEWLKRASEELGLSNAEVIGSRLELVPDFASGVISARAFAPLSKLLDLSSRFSTRDTLWVLPKGRSATQELDELRGWRHAFHVKQSLTDPDAGIIVGKLSGRKAR